MAAFFVNIATMSDATVSLDHLFLGRQPILDASEALIGYELFFRNSTENAAPPIEPGFATADVVCKAFVELGLANALAGNRAFVIADAEFLRHESVVVLPAESIVFEVDAGLATNPVIIERCRQLADLGFSFCLNHPAELNEQLQPFLALSSYIKLNVPARDDVSLKRLLDLSGEHKPMPIASHIESHADRERALALGFGLFQGYYFARPTLVEGRKVDPATQGLLHIINLLNRDAELTEVEQAFKGEAALTMKLLRLTNSAGIGLRVRIGSVRQAINVIGRLHIQRWLQLLLFSQQGGGDIERNPLMQLAALKGNFMERLARHCHPQQTDLHDQAFLAGLMSLMPAVLGMVMAEILDQLAITPSLRQALLLREGEVGALLELTEHYDSENLPGVTRMLNQLECRIGGEVLNQCLAESIAWVQGLTVEATG